MSDQPDSLHALLFKNPDGTYSVGDRCTTLTCAVQSVRPLASGGGEIVAGRVIMDREPGSALKYWQRYGAPYPGKVGTVRPYTIDHTDRMIWQATTNPDAAPPAPEERLSVERELYHIPPNAAELSNAEILMRHARITESGANMPSWMPEELAYRLACLMEQTP